MRSFRSVAFVVPIAILITACGPDEPPDVTRTEDGVLRLGSVEAVDTVARAVAPKERPVVVEGMRGSVSVRGDSGQTASFSFVRRGRGDEPESARSVLNGISVLESGTQSDYTFTLTAEENEDYAAVDVHGVLPETGSLRVDRVSGPVLLDGVRGRVVVRHDYGSVEVYDAAGEVDVDIRSGDVRVGFVSLPSEAPIRLHTANGDIDLGLPAEADARIDARTQVGVIQTQGLTLTPERFGPVDAGAGYEAQLGSGGPTIELRTENGHISIQRTDTTWVAPSMPRVIDTTVVPLSDTTVMPAPTDTMSADTLATDTTATDTAGLQP